MNRIIHILGCIVKFILLNLKASLKVLKSCTYDVLDLSIVDTVVSSHNLGEGTLSYERNNFYADNILIIRLISYRWDGFFSVEQGNSKIYISSKRLFSLLAIIVPKNVIVSSLCSYSNPVRFLKFIELDFLNAHKKYLVHDFHSVCPSVNLIENKFFCSLNCANCSKYKFIKKWQTEWNHFFEVVDEIVVFSNSSKEIIKTVYGSIKDEKIKVIPHSMDYCNFEKIETNNGKNIAIIGNCSNIAKGKYVIKNLIPYIKKERNRKLYIIGKTPFFFHRNSEFIYYNGAYRLAELRDILIEFAIGAIVFPSVWPETFSYAISAFMQLGLPIVTVDMGAQGEKLRRYDKTVFIENYRPESIIEGVEKCFTL